VTERQAGRILTLPVNQFMTDAEVQRVADTATGFSEYSAGMNDFLSYKALVEGI